MIKSILITGTEANSGKLLISLGLLDVLLGKTRKVAYFKPLVSDTDQYGDDHIAVVRGYFNLAGGYSDLLAYRGSDLCCQLETEDQGPIIDTIIRKFKNLEETNDFTVIEGTDYVDKGTIAEFDLNLQLAKNLCAPVILVMNGREKTPSQVIRHISAALHRSVVQGIQVLAVIVNYVRPGNVHQLNVKLSRQLTPPMLPVVIPEVRELERLTIHEIRQKLRGKWLAGKKLLSNPVDHWLAGATEIPELLKKLKENTLIVTPGDRDDIITMVLLAHLSSAYPDLAGLVLTDGYQPGKALLKLLKGLPSLMPILAVDRGMAETISQIEAIQPGITAADTKTIQLAIDTFHKFADVSRLAGLLITAAPPGITPRMFQYRLVKRAGNFKAKIVLPEGHDERILTCAARLVWLGLVDIILLGDRNKIRDLVKKQHIHLETDKLKIIDPRSDAFFTDYANTLYTLRKKEKMTLYEARMLMKDPSCFGTMMVYKGHADGMVGGAVYTTRQTILPALQFIKARKGKSLVSSIFFMCLKDRVVLFGDCAVNPDPTAEQLAEIAISSAETAQDFGIEPRIAMISYASGTSGVGKTVDKVRRATEIVKRKRPEFMIEGPIQYDAAVDPVIGAGKLPGSRVAGRATVLIFPDLDTGNCSYKAVQQEAGAVAIGPILQDLNKPVNDLSRGGTVDDIFNTIVVTAIQCQRQVDQGSTDGVPAIN